MSKYSGVTESTSLLSGGMRATQINANVELILEARMFYSPLYDEISHGFPLQIFRDQMLPLHETFRYVTKNRAYLFLYEFSMQMNLRAYFVINISQILIMIS